MLDAKRRRRSELYSLRLLFYYRGAFGTPIIEYIFLLCDRHGDYLGGGRGEGSLEQSSDAFVGSSYGVVGGSQSHTHHPHLMDTPQDFPMVYPQAGALLRFRSTEITTAEVNIKIVLTTTYKKPKKTIV